MLCSLSKFKINHSKQRKISETMALSCRICKQQGVAPSVDFDTLDMLEAHLAQDHFQHLPFACTLCPKFGGGFFPTEHTAIQHVAAVHGQNIQGPDRKFDITYQIREDSEQKRAKIRQSLLEHCVIVSGEQQQQQKMAENPAATTMVAKKESTDSIVQTNTSTSSSRSLSHTSNTRDFVGNNGAPSPLRSAVERSITRSSSGFGGTSSQGYKGYGNRSSASNKLPSSHFSACHVADGLKAFHLSPPSASPSPPPPSSSILDSPVAVIERALFQQVDESKSPRQWVNYALTESGYNDVKFDPKILQEVANSMEVHSAGVANFMEAARSDVGPNRPNLRTYLLHSSGSHQYY